MDKMIIGVFGDTNHAEMAINQLEEKNYNPKDMSIIMKEHEKGKEMAEKTGADVSSGAVSGATTGGVMGALAGLLVGAGVIPGLGALFIGGPLVAALGLTGAAAATISGATTGAVAGGLVGALGGLGIAGKDAAEYEERIKQGGILVAVPVTAAGEEEVKSVLQQHGADTIRSIAHAHEHAGHHSATA